MFAVREEDRSCQFPSWVTQHRRYHSLSGATTLNINQGGSTISVQVSNANSRLISGKLSHILFLLLNIQRANFTLRNSFESFDLFQPRDVGEAGVEGLRSSRLECLSSQILTNLTAKYIVQSVQSCSQATFHCVQLWRRTENVLQIKIGKVAPSNEDACDENLFFDSSVPTHTITSKLTHGSAGGV